MEVSVAEAKNRLPSLIRAMEAGEQIVITRRGKPVAQLAPASAAKKRTVEFGTMRGKVWMKPGWDDPITEEQFFSGDY